MAFIFLVTFWGTPPQIYVLDHGLTGEDCVRLVEEYKGEGIASCELDQGERK